MEFETTIEINAPADRVWTALADIESWPKWTDSMDEVKYVNATALGPGVKARIKQPRTPALIWEVYAFKPGVSFAWRTTSPVITTLGTHKVAAAGTNRATLTLGIQQTGLLARLIGLLTRARTEKYIRMEANGLKNVCEA